MRGHIAKKGKKYYIVVDFDKDDNGGKRNQKWLSGYERKKDAENAMPDILSKLKNGTYVEPSKKTFGEIMETWLEDKKTSVKYGTWKSYEWLVHKHIIPHLGKKKMAKLKPQDLHDFYHKTLLKTLSVGSIKKAHVLIMDALNRAVTWGEIPHNVASTVALPQGKKTKFQVWNEEQLKIFLDAATDNQYFVAFELAASTGMRQSEILALRWVDTDLQTKTISVRQAYTLAEKGHEMDDTKNDSSIRSIALFESTVRLLTRHKDTREQELENNEIHKDSGLVIQTSIGTPLGPRLLMRHYYRILKQISEGYPSFPNIRFHDLRHTHATLLLKAGVHPKIVQERLGHSSINVTLDTYSHVLPNLQEAVLRGIGDSILGGRHEVQEETETTTLLE
ncbi:site-specific integrase [Paenibacillus sp. 19GGS1-52]|uniref:site-specific integrase n=1 Tax=Paenibacillus sp. 19GGS1-52 TaxID=2758563 RepID=UPI001EFBED86|nr:site-specific integrase [Paenibacillus sp. 19GGS1-52]ULO07175.1 site-specific integrase [Paenibacillus sp. 19GGS1-52]